MTIQAGQIITIGTAKFIVDDIRDGHRVGDIALRYTLRDGFIKLNGATVLRADYPRLVQWVDDNNLWTDDDSALGLFGVGDGLTTMRLPDFRNKFIESVDSNGGAVIGAGLPNISANFLSTPFAQIEIYSAGGAFYIADYLPGQGVVGLSSGTHWNATNFGTAQIVLNAARSSGIYGASSTVQPAAVRLIAQIKY